MNYNELVVKLKLFENRYASQAVARPDTDEPFP